MLVEMGWWPASCPPRLWPHGVGVRPVASDGTAVLESGHGIGSSHSRGACKGYRLYQAASRGPQWQNKDAIHGLWVMRLVIYGGLSCGHLCI